MKLKIIVMKNTMRTPINKFIVVIAITFLLPAKGSENNFLFKEVPPKQYLLMLKVKYDGVEGIPSGYAEPVLFLENRSGEVNTYVRLSLDNCCSDDSFKIEYLVSIVPTQRWDSIGISALNGKNISFGKVALNNQILTEQGARLSSFQVNDSDESGTVLFFLVGSLEELKKSYSLKNGQAFNWELGKITFSE